MTTSISVVIVNWNGGALLDACLESVVADAQRLIRTTGRTVELLVVDNGSTDGSQSIVDASYPDVGLLQLPDNLGFGAGVNRGIAHTSGDYVVLVNNDAVVRPGFLDGLVQPMEADPRIGAVTGLVLLAGTFAPGAGLHGERTFRGRGGVVWHRVRPGVPGRQLVNSRGNTVDASGNGSDEGWLEPAGDNTTSAASFPPREVFGFNGGCAALRREALSAVGVFDESLFMYYEDTDLSWRLRRHGWTVVHSPSAVTDHQHSASSGADSMFFAVHNARNRLVVAVLHGPWTMVGLAYARTLVRIVKGPQRRAATQALAQALRRLPGDAARRRRHARTATVPTRAVRQH